MPFRDSSGPQSLYCKDSEYAIEMVKYNKGLSMNDATILWMINDLKCIHSNARQGDCGRLNLP